MISARRRIAVLLPDLRGGGVERMRIALAREWLARGYAVEFVLLHARGELLSHVPSEASIVDLHVGRFRAALLPLVRYLRHARPDVLLAGMWPLTVLAPLAGAVAGRSTRVVVTEHSMLSESYRDRRRGHRQIMRLTMALSYRLADERVAVSSGVARDLAVLSALPTKAFRVTHNPACGFRPADVAAESLPGVAGPLVLTVGNLKPVKDHATLIEAFARLDPELAATLCILGEGQLRGELERLVEERGLEGRVFFPGFRDDPRPYYQRADVFVLSSRHEGFGNVLVEALEAGLPIVSTDCPGGPREILADGKYGRLVPVGDVHAMSLAMADSLRTRARDVRAGARDDADARRARAAEFDVKVIAARYLDLLFPGRPDDSVRGATRAEADDAAASRTDG